MSGERVGASIGVGTGDPSPAPTRADVLEDELLAAGKWLSDHLTSVGAVAVPVIFVIGVLGAAEGDIDTARGIIAASGPVSVALGILVEFGPLLLVVLSLGWAIYELWRWRLDSGSLGRFCIPAALMAVVLAVFVPMRAALDIAVLSIFVLLLMGWFPSRHDGAVTVKVLGVAMGAFLLIGAFLFVGILWLPTERIVPGHGSPYTGFVLADTTGGEVVLRSDDRAIVDYEGGRTPSHQICTNGTTATRVPLWYYLVHPPDPGYPSCPK
jgi:hypothetical protein